MGIVFKYWDWVSCIRFFDVLGIYKRQLPLTHTHAYIVQSRGESFDSPMIDQSNRTQGENFFGRVSYLFVNMAFQLKNKLRKNILSDMWFEMRRT